MRINNLKDVSTYIINLKERNDKKDYILNEIKKQGIKEYSLYQPNKHSTNPLSVSFRDE